MKKLILIIAIVISGMLAQAQTDLEIANAIIDKPFYEMEAILDTFDIDYYIVQVEEDQIVMYIQKKNNVKKWILKYGNIYKTEKAKGGTHFKDVATKINIILEIFVRYRHSNINDLNEFYAYEVPESTKIRTYEKSLGTDTSHLKVVQNK